MSTWLPSSHSSKPGLRLDVQRRTPSPRRAFSHTFRHARVVLIAVVAVFTVVDLTVTAQAGLALVVALVVVLAVAVVARLVAFLSLLDITPQVTSQRARFGRC